MQYDELVTGAVITYPYLWAREQVRGETAGRKERPTVVGVRARHAKGSDILLLFPITSKPPLATQWAVELPETEKRRAGLDGDMRLWLVMQECNMEVLPGSFFLEPQAPLGHLSRKFLLPLLKEFIQRRDKMAAVNRMK